jgi:hypothetical protein
MFVGLVLNSPHPIPASSDVFVMVLASVLFVSQGKVIKLGKFKPNY